MKTVLMICLSVGILGAADGTPKKKKAAPAAAATAKPAPAAKPAPTAKPLEVPAGAVAFEPGMYRYTDAQGKKWIYRQTPFGIVRLEDTEANAAPPTVTLKSQDTVSAVEDGDTIRFTRQTPFGVQKWQKKKTEMDEMEKALWERQRDRTAK